MCEDLFVWHVGQTTKASIIPHTTACHGISNKKKLKILHEPSMPFKTMSPRKRNKRGMHGNGALLDFFFFN